MLPRGLAGVLFKDAVETRRIVEARFVAGIQDVSDLLL
jgi:hypothetical protein